MSMRVLQDGANKHLAPLQLAMSSQLEDVSPGVDKITDSNEQGSGKQSMVSRCTSLPAQQVKSYDPLPANC